eukprot:1195230-Prorocentrum_minimum.AAC.1
MLLRVTGPPEPTTARTRSTPRKRKRKRSDVSPGDRPRARLGPLGFYGFSLTSARPHKGRVVRFPGPESDGERLS